MNNSHLGKQNLGKLYRRFTRAEAVAAPLPQAETLVALAEGDRSIGTQRLLADVARSGVHADLLRFARALQPESARLGVQLERALETPVVDHARQQRRAARVTAPRRGWLRVTASLAAGLIVAMGVWSVARMHPAQPANSSARAATAIPDRIFAALGSEHSAARPSRADQIFHANFNRDAIFKSEFSDG